MISNSMIIGLVVFYVIIVAGYYKYYLNKNFAGNELAGNAMAKGLTLFYGLGVLFLIAIVFTIVGSLFFKDITSIGVKFIFFIPISLSLLLFSATFLNYKAPKFIIRFLKGKQEKEQAHQLIFEIRTKEKLESAAFLFMTAKKDSLIMFMLANEKREGDFYVYENRTAIFKDNKRLFYISSDGYETPECNLEIPYKPQIIPFTNWEVLNVINKNTQGRIVLEFRYKVIDQPNGKQ